MISEKNNQTKKRLKGYDKEHSTMNQIQYEFSKKVHPAVGNGELGVDKNEKNMDETQDILAKACSAIGLGSCIELNVTPNKTDKVKLIKNKIPVPHIINDFRNQEKHNGQYPNGNYTNPYCMHSKSYLENHRYANRTNEAQYGLNKYSSRKMYNTSVPDIAHHNAPYPSRNMWRTMDKSQMPSQIDRSQYYTNRPYIPTQQACRLNYNNSITRHQQNAIPTNYMNPENKRYAYQYANPYQRNNTCQIATSMNSCRFLPPNYTTSNSHFPGQTNIRQQVTNNQSTENVYGYSQLQSDFAMNKKIPHVENVYKLDLSKSSKMSQYCPISSPISPSLNNERQSPNNVNHFEQQSGSQTNNTSYNSIKNNLVNNEQKIEYRKSFSNEFYEMTPYKEDFSNRNYVKNLSRRHSSTNVYGLNGVEKSHQSFVANQNSKHLYLPDCDQLNVPNIENSSNYNFNTIHCHIPPVNVRYKEPNSSYNNYKNTNMVPNHNHVESNVIPIDYSVYGTDEIIKNSVKITKNNLPHSPNVELIPFEGTSIISNVSELSSGVLPEESINSMKCIPSKDNISSYPKDNYSSSVIKNPHYTIPNNDLTNCRINRGNACIEQTKNKEYCHEEYTNIPELTSIADVERMQYLEYPQLGNKEVNRLESTIDYKSINDHDITSQDIKVDNILNSHLAGINSKIRPASEPLFQQIWANSDEMKRPLSVPVNNTQDYSDTVCMIPEEKIKINKFQQKLRPVLEHLLSIPEASSLLSLKENPKELLKHLVKLWGGVAAVSCSTVPLINLKENFLMLVKLLFKSSLLLEWGWQNATADRILDDLVKPSDEGISEYKASMEILSFICHPIQEFKDVTLPNEDFSSLSENCSEFIYE